ncbi:MAG: SDR family oxidoreductase [Sandaracinaceae bacterium]|nr:SDR family oxidoreductase [Sandaracinaceae bacterium]
MELRDKTFVVTGANTGLGRATVEALADRGAGRLVVASRSRDKTQPVLDALRARAPSTDVRFVALDLGELASVRRAADEILAMDLPIDVLVNNAGIAGLQGLTKDGFELTFGTNHLGPWLLTEKLLPLVQRAPQGRIVNVSSEGHYRAKGIDWDALRKPTAHTTALPEYFVSKLCNVLHAKELARRLAGTKVTTYSVHPGGVASDIWQRRMGKFALLLRPFLLTNEQGARTQLRCATDPALATESGLFYDKERAKEPNPLSHDVALQDELRRRSAEWTK